MNTTPAGPAREYVCTECGTTYPVYSAAETCAEQDAVEERDTRRILRSTN